MDHATLVGIDLGKHSFHLHGQDRNGKAVFRKKLGRKQLIEFFAMYEVCTVVMEACAGSHHMARKLANFGHEVKLISPQFVRPFVKSNKNDFVDAEAICEAAARPAMRFLTPKTESQQTLSVLHRVRESMVRDRTRTTNQMDAFLLESGVRLPVGKTAVARRPEFLDAQALPPRLIAILERLHEHLKYLEKQIGEIERERAHQLADDDVGQRLMSIPGIGPITARVLAAEMGDGRQYGCSRDFAASVGLVPRQYSTGGRSNLLGISRRGDKHVRCLLVLCARAYLRGLEKRTGRLAEWARAMMTRRHSNVVACALANKLARTAWAIVARHSTFDSEFARPSA
ncbi:IS110 family transposase [Paraburkholderia sp. UYCP14C]|uniref:IS110 family transposase n=1 Tax=Paraburkholderia sp. UYCP14C TaxID=2511130 RepID=UPI0010205277|nr:IS110 family transposase [Paraburkholderia sp. UYCP14C]RZF27302.1 IS110 family transposase [Paraburkholderia sp. UYCP14C]